LAERGLAGLRVAILADDGFEEAELTEPRRALDDAGAETSLYRLA
jgi:protease I